MNILHINELRNFLVNSRHSHYEVHYIGKSLNYSMSPLQVVSDFDYYDLWGCVKSYSVDYEKFIITIEMGY